MRKSGVYFISDGKYVKIGKGNSPLQRLKNIQTGNGNRLELLFYLPYECEADAFMIERTLHYFYRNKRIGGEWFDILNDVDGIVISAMFGDSECLVFNEGNLVSIFNGTKLSIEKIRKTVGIETPHFKRFEAQTEEEAINRMRAVLERSYAKTNA